MSQKKISELNPLENISGNYVFPVVDTDNSQTKKVTFEDLVNNTLPVLNVTAANITGNTVETVAPTLGLTSDNKLCYLRPGGGTGDWENVLVSESGDFVSNIQLANAAGTVLEENVLGHVGGKLVVGDGVTVAEELGSNTNSDLMQTFFYTGTGVDQITSGNSNQLQRISVPCSYKMLNDLPAGNTSQQPIETMFYIEADFAVQSSFELNVALFMQPQITISPSGAGTYGQFYHSLSATNTVATPRLSNATFGPFHYDSAADNRMQGYLVPSRTGSNNGMDALFDTELTLTGFGPYSNNPSSDDYSFSSSTAEHFMDSSAVAICSITGEQGGENTVTYDVSFKGLYKAAANYTKIIRKQEFDIDFYFCNANRHAFTGIANNTVSVSNAVIKIFPIA